MALPIRLWIMIVSLFYMCWIIGIVIQTVSVLTFGITFGITFRTFVGFLCILLTLASFSIYRWFIFWKLKRMPYVPVNFPYIFGNVSSDSHLAERFADFYKNFGTEQCPIVGMVLLLEPVVLIRDLKFARSVLSSENFAYFQDRGMYQNARDDPLSTVLGSIAYTEWETLRPKLTRAFTPAKIKHMFSIMKAVGDEFVKGLNEIIEVENQVEIRCLFSRFATEIIGSVAIGIQCNTPEFQKMKQQAMQSYLQFPLNIFTAVYPNVARFFGIRKHAKEVCDFFIDVIEQTIESRAQNNEKRNDFLQLLMGYSDLTTNQIAALAFDFLSAGYSDSTSTLSYCLYELSLPENKNVQKNARKEIESVLEQHGGKITYAALLKMTYCKLIIKETLRKHPVAANITRITTKPFKVPNTDFTIPEGMRVYVPILAFFHDDLFFSNPNQFDPERFSAGDSDSFMPFGIGPRQCIGFRFANLLIITALVSLLRNFKFSACDRTQPQITYSTTKNTLIPKDGIWLNVQQI